MTKFEANNFYMPNESHESIHTDYTFKNTNNNFNNCYMSINNFNAESPNTNTNNNKLTHESTAITNGAAYEDETV